MAGFFQRIWMRIRRRGEGAPPAGRAGSAAGPADDAGARKRMRLQSCIDAILDANARMDSEVLDSHLVAHFQTLKRVMEGVDPETLQDRELDMIEAATNRLLRDMKRFYDIRRFTLHSKDGRVN